MTALQVVYPGGRRRDFDMAHLRESIARSSADLLSPKDIDAVEAELARVLSQRGPLVHSDEIADEVCSALLGKNIAAGVRYFLTLRRAKGLPDLSEWLASKLNHEPDNAPAAQLAVTDSSGFQSPFDRTRLLRSIQDATRGREHFGEDIAQRVLEEVEAQVAAMAQESSRVDRHTIEGLVRSVLKMEDSLSYLSYALRRMEEPTIDQISRLILDASESKETGNA